MRSRAQIQKQMFDETLHSGTLSVDMFDKGALVIELLLDIRDSLHNRQESKPQPDTGATN